MRLPKVDKKARITPTTGDRRQATGDRRQATGNRQQATGNRQQATGNRQQATGNRHYTLGRFFLVNYTKVKLPKRQQLPKGQQKPTLIKPSHFPRLTGRSIRLYIFQLERSFL
jgi:uncharacterized protein YjbJ (UPF0337 family)